MTTETRTGLSRARLAEYIAGLSDDDLFELAVQVNVWRTLLQGTGYDATRELLVVALSRVGNAFNDRRQRGQWGKVWLTVWMRIGRRPGPTPPDVVRAHVAEWAAGIAE